MRSSLRLAIVLGVSAACNTTTTTSSSSTNACSNTSAAATVNASDVLAFSPGSVTITHGQSVCWQNNGTVSHTVTNDAASGETFNSALPGSGGTFVHIFPNPGTFGYHCTIHPGMAGSVTVN